MAEEHIDYDLEDIYSRRSIETAPYRNRVWQILCREFFHRHVPEDGSVIDLGAGHGEFINNIACATKYAMDLNAHAGVHCAADVTFLHQDCSKEWPLEEEALDVVFTSNFLEHLPSKSALTTSLRQARRCLKSGGKMICVGPNFRYASDQYWDRFDHYIPLSHLSLAEALEVSGLRVSTCIGRFLPFTMLDRQPPLVLLKLYLRLPFAWRFVGKQFLVIARKA